MTGLNQRLRGMLRGPLHGVTQLAASLRPDAAHLPAWERTVLDDIAARRPWNIRVKAERRVALARSGGLRDGVTIVIVNWNTCEVTSDVIDSVAELTPSGVRVLVVDNGSTDGSREMLRARTGIDKLFLRSNAGHGVALDLALCRVRTKVAVTLDSDALPLVPGWLEPAVRPVAEGRAILAGLRASRDFVHPVFSAVSTAAFVQRRLSFQTLVPPGLSGAAANWGENAWDTGEMMTRRLPADEVTFVEPTANLVSGLPGMTVGGVVYHHGGVSRSTGGAPDPSAMTVWRDSRARLRSAVADGHVG
ncbi:MAG: glycosyltransferase [Micropruina sp.]|nr:glycosyltransferase [Micropruina sp.]